MGTPKRVPSPGEDYAPHPEGQFIGRCVDVIDHGWVLNRQWQKHEHKTTFVFYCGQNMENGTPLLVRRRFTTSLHRKSALRPFLGSWRGAPMLEEDCANFDLEKVYGMGALLQIVHATDERGTFANISSVMRPPPDAVLPAAPADYVRMEDREDWEGPAPHPAMSEPPEQSTPPPAAPTPAPEASLDEPDDDLPW